MCVLSHVIKSLGYNIKNSVTVNVFTLVLVARQSASLQSLNVRLVLKSNYSPVKQEKKVKILQKIPRIVAGDTVPSPYENFCERGNLFLPQTGGN